MCGFISTKNILSGRNEVMASWSRLCAFKTLWQNAAVIARFAKVY
ncbi:hypothetical protein Cflav_PD0740 [Pedosphaera parvula Ellin514]|uniref:Uncharacterized protein n=1 Tax=Pedosphaera parvula (strain Ellin514) TaxID=320771 RepID=B9XR92_PEDPL|nr:hypothetical protein Cflav_PD0740 [Pedosphaera parvula Ellin514]